MFAEIHIERGRIRAVLPCLTGTIVRTETDSFEFPGCHVSPGFVDSHAHVVGLGERLAAVSLHDAPSLEDCLSRLSGSITSETTWLRAMGWNQERWSSRDWPSREDLDRCSSVIPIIAMRVDGHAMWVNTAALKAAGLDPTSQSGILIDDAMRPVWSAMPASSREEVREQILRATNVWVQHGVTEIHDMDVLPEWLECFRELAESGHLPVRIQSFVRGQDREWIEAGLLPAGGELHRIAGVKLFADGALGSRGAYLRSQYSDNVTTQGIELLSVDMLTSRMREIVDAGWSCIAVHAIGDAAVRNVLDAYDVVRGLPDGRDLILRIEHAQHVHPDDVDRCRRLGVIACVQSTHCCSDAMMAEVRLGAERLPWAYRWKTLIDAGITMTGGSDAPIESPSVIEGLRAFVHRTPYGMSSSWMPAERITSQQAVDAYTAIAHHAAGMEYRRGALHVGFDADLVVTSHDVCEYSDHIGNDISIQATFTAGRLRYSA